MSDLLFLRGPIRRLHSSLASLFDLLGLIFPGKLDGQLVARGLVRPRLALVLVGLGGLLARSLGLAGIFLFGSDQLERLLPAGLLEHLAYVVQGKLGLASHVF